MRPFAFYTRALGFRVFEDTDLGGAKRWVLVGPPDSKGTQLLLAQAANAEQASRIGNQTGGRVFLFLYTDDLARDFQAFRTKGIEFVREPKVESYGTVAVFKDLYGNLWDLLQLT
jgi:catechol 2,3-dioxygenase-like lactoylglutathione lyase family enzyme